MNLENLLIDLNDLRSLVKEVFKGTEYNVEIVFSKEFLNISSTLHKNI